MASIHWKYYSPTLKTRTDLRVLLPTPQPPADCETEALPALFAAPGEKLPVLYLLHGTYGDEGDWQRFSRIEDYVRGWNLIVVMAGAGNHCYRNGPGGAFDTFFAEELPALLRWALPVSDRREDTFIDGLSMCGSGALALSLRHPERYSRAICLSGAYGEILRQVEAGPTVWSNAFAPGEAVVGGPDDPYVLAEQAAARGGPRPALYLACGTEDFLYGHNCRFHDHLTRLGYDHQFHTRPGVHNWDFWDPELRRALAWLPVRRLEAPAF